jgi:L-ascorbate metabolism protein UlaG (beta-lactamase superfamily)
MPVQYGDIRLSWLGHDGFLIQGKKTLYIDPYEIDTRDKPEADYMLITHSHYDHLSIPDIEPLLTPNTTVFCPPDCSSKLTKLKMKQLKVMEPGSVYEDGNVRIEAVPAYNKDKPFHPRENDWLGYVFTLDKITVYHSGDTDLIPEMEKIKCDIALLPVSGKYVMTADEAAKAAALIKPDVCIPMHWGALVGSKEDAEHFKKLVKCESIILEKE